MQGKMWAGRREGVTLRWRKRHEREGPQTKGWAPQGTRGAHPEHAAHGCDTGRVEAQRLVEGYRALPSRKGGLLRE